MRGLLKGYQRVIRGLFRPERARHAHNCHTFVTRPCSMRVIAEDMMEMRMAGRRPYLSENGPSNNDLMITGLSGLSGIFTGFISCVIRVIRERERERERETCVCERENSMVMLPDDSSTRIRGNRDS